MTEDERESPQVDYTRIHELLLKARNPFKNSIVENPRQPIVDVESINAELTNLILKSIEAIRKKEKRTDLILIQGEPGLGKTHFLSRMRQKAKEHAYFFVDLPPVGDISRIYSHIFQQLFINLSWKDPRERFSPLQQLVGDLLSKFLITSLSAEQNSLQSQTREILSALKEDHTQVFHYLQLSAKKAEIRERILEKTILDLLSRYPGIDQLFLEVLFKIIDEDSEFLALKWLKGYDLSETDLKRLNVRTSIDNDETANRVLSSLLMIIDRPILFCLDQLESFSVRFEAENGIKILFDTLTNMYNRYQNLCMLLMCQSHVWTEIEKTVEKSALDRIQIKKSLTKLSFEEGILLVESRLRLIYPPTLSLPYGTYPFSHDFIRHILKETGFNPRKLLNRLSREFEYLQSKKVITEPIPAELAPLPLKEPEAEPVIAFLTRELEALKTQIQQDQSHFYPLPVRQDFLKGILNELFKEIYTRQISFQGITIKHITLNRKVTKKDVDITLSVEKEAVTFKIGIEINNSENMTSLFHTLRRLLNEIQKHQLKYVFLIRDAALWISPTAHKTQDLLKKLQQHGAFIRISEEDLLELMSMKKLLEKASSGDLMRGDLLVSRHEVLQFLLPDKIANISILTSIFQVLNQGPLSEVSLPSPPIPKPSATPPRLQEPKAPVQSEPLTQSEPLSRSTSPAPTPPSSTLIPSDSRSQSASDRLEELFDNLPEFQSPPALPPTPSTSQTPSSTLPTSSPGIQRTNLKGSILRILRKQHFYTLKKLKESFPNIDLPEIREALQNMVQEQLIIMIHDRNEDTLFAIHPNCL
ncbi:MAG: hypothetical protein ACTSRS_09950 [Candidatus Helarchaeota archaeon]